MGYHIQLYTIQTRQAQMAMKEDTFFENPKNFIPFTNEQYENLIESLKEYNYYIEKQENDTIYFLNEEYKSIQAILDTSALYLSSSFTDSFEIGMMASELTDTNEFAKYDPQNVGWEIIE